MDLKQLSKSLSREILLWDGVNGVGVMLDSNTEVIDIATNGNDLLTHRIKELLIEKGVDLKLVRINKSEQFRIQNPISNVDQKTIQEIYKKVLSQRKVNLNPVQDHKFLFACEKSIAENPNLSLEDWTYAANVYLNYILRYPTIDLGPIIEPTE
jgi:hypothetical protein